MKNQLIEKEANFQKAQSVNDTKIESLESNVFRLHNKCEELRLKLSTESQKSCSATQLDRNKDELEDLKNRSEEVDAKNHELVAELHEAKKKEKNMQLEIQNGSQKLKLSEEANKKSKKESRKTAAAFFSFLCFINSIAPYYDHANSAFTSKHLVNRNCSPCIINVQKDDPIYHILLEMMNPEGKLRFKSLFEKGWFPAGQFAASINTIVVGKLLDLDIKQSADRNGLSLTITPHDEDRLTRRNGQIVHLGAK